MATRNRHAVGYCCFFVGAVGIGLGLIPEAVPMFVPVAAFAIAFIGVCYANRWKFGGRAEMNNDKFGPDMKVNPATGLTMVGSVDTAGNPFGVDNSSR